MPMPSPGSHNINNRTSAELLLLYLQKKICCFQCSTVFTSGTTRTAHALPATTQAYWKEIEAIYIITSPMVLDQNVLFCQG